MLFSDECTFKEIVLEVIKGDDDDDMLHLKFVWM